MDFSGRIVLCFIEEDNTQRAYFRIRPLLTAEGLMTKADIDALPDDGYLRIVPDKNEQHTFKDRMRELGQMCVLDLINIPPDAVKVRSNKNYAPQRGENNQFIVYSDAVQAIPAQLFYEVITAETGEKEKIAKAATPLCYLRSGGRIYGPVSRATGLDQDGAALLAPDSEGLSAVMLPDGSEKLFYWPRSGVKAVAVKNEGESEEKPAANEKLSGVPFYQTAARRPNMPQRAHNALVDTVDQQLRASKLEAPGAQINAGAPLQRVENPMDAFKRALGALWPMPEMQRQAAAHFLSMTGVRNILNQQLAGKETDAVSAAINSQIEDLEAERLALLMQLESGKKNMALLRQEALSQLTQSENEIVRRLRAEEAAARADIEKINGERAALLEERDQVLSDMSKADHKTLRLAAQVGGHAEMNMLCERVQQSMAAQGLACSKDEAVHLLTVLCLCDGQLEITSAATADAKAAAQALGMALGASFVYNGVAGREVRTVQGGDAFRLVIAPQAASDRDQDYIRIVARGIKAVREQSLYAMTPWPAVRVNALSGWKFAQGKTYPPVQAASLRDAVLRNKVEPGQSALQVLQEIDAALGKSAAPLPQCTKRMIYSYLCVAPMHMEGSIAKALDYAVSTWIIPHVKVLGVNPVLLKGLLGGLNISLSLLEG